MKTSFANPEDDILWSNLAPPLAKLHSEQRLSIHQMLEMIYKLGGKHISAASNIIRLQDAYASLPEDKRLEFVRQIKGLNE